MVSKNSKGEQYTQMVELINDAAVSKMEKLRLALIFAIKYENDPKLFELKKTLK